MRKRQFGFFLIFMQIIGLFSCIPVENPAIHPSDSKPTIGQKPSIPIHLSIGKFDPLIHSGPALLPPDLIIQNYPRTIAGYYILQFKGPVLEKWKEDVAAAGASFFDYIPEFAFIVKMGYNAYKNVRAMDPVRWVGVYQPGYRIAPGLPSAISENEDRKVDVLVSVFSGENLSAIMESIKGLGGEILSVPQTKDRLTITIPAARIVDLAHLNGIKYIEMIPNFKLTSGNRKI